MPVIVILNQKPIRLVYSGALKIDCFGFGGPTILMRHCPLSSVQRYPPAYIVSAGWNMYNEIDDTNDDPSVYGGYTTSPPVYDLGYSKIACGCLGEHIVAITPTGSVKTWGRNDYGQCGVSPSWSESRNNDPMDTIPARECSAGMDHTMIVGQDGYLYGTGRNNVGQLGDGSCVDFEEYTQIGTYSGWSKVSCGTQFTLALRSDGTLWACGLNSSGQCGVGTTTNVLQFVRLGTSTWRDISAGNNFAMGVRMDGTLWAWGDNTYGQLSMGVFGGSYLAPTIADISNIVAHFGGDDFIIKHLSCGGKHSGIIANAPIELYTEQTYVVGDNSDGQLGPPIADVTTDPPWAPENLLRSVTDDVSNQSGIMCGMYTTVVLRYGWPARVSGRDVHGMLSTGDFGLTDFVDWITPYWDNLPYGLSECSGIALGPGFLVALGVIVSPY